MTNTKNQVSVTGRVSRPVEFRTLPSGDVLATFRLIVDRSGAALKRSKNKVDTFECAVWKATVRKRVETLGAGDVVTVTGELRRRFFRGSGRPTSFVSIEVDTVRKFRAGA